MRYVTMTEFNMFRRCIGEQKIRKNKAKANVHKAALLTSLRLASPLWNTSTIFLIMDFGGERFLSPSRLAVASNV